MKKIFALSLIILIGLPGCKEQDNKKITSPPELVRDIDRIKLTDMNGQPLSLKQYAGKTIFINFWATWCKPCVQEMPSIHDAQNTLKNNEIIFFLASDENPEQIKEFGASHNYKFNYVRIENSEEMNVQTLPTTFIFNSAGNKVFMETGARQWNEKNNIDTILKIINTK
jgi:thiol-disulfide isomerase/thioredoxin